MEKSGAKTNEVITRDNGAYFLNYENGECLICCEDGLIIPCKICEKTACKTCIRRFILENESDNAVCMFCSSVFTRHTLVEMLGVTFVKGQYTERLQQIKLNKQKLLLPTFQPIAERQIECETVQSEIDSLYEKINLKKRRLNELKFGKKTEVKKYTRPCSIPNCNGFLDSSWKCGICSIVTCKDCFEPIADDEHVCEAGAKDTATLLKRDTKNCPKCGEGIYKIDGCDQMYCTSCHTAFSWKTGEIVSGRIHNPHYYQHLRNMAPDGQIHREPGDIPQTPCCAERVNDEMVRSGYTIISLLSKILKFPNGVENSVNAEVLDGIIKSNIVELSYLCDIIDKFFISIIRYYYHVDSIRIRFVGNITEIENKVRDLSVDFIRNKIKKEKYEKDIIKIQKKREIIDERVLILSTLCDIINDIIVKYYNDYVNTLVTIYLGSRNSLQSIEGLKTYLELYVQQYNIFKQNTGKSQDEIRTIINYCLNEDKKIQRSYGTTSQLGINIRPNVDKFLEKF